MKRIFKNSTFSSLVSRSTGTWLVVSAVFLLMSYSCKSQQKADRQEQAMPLLHFQKTTCLGSCPAYQAHIATDGQVIFIGFAHVPTTDSLFFQLSAIQLDSLKTEIDALNYTTLQDLYPTQWSDMPSTHTTFYKDGKEVKHVKHREGGPETLRNFQNWLDKILLAMAEAEAYKRLPDR